MEKRRKPRQQRRLSCELWVDGKRHSCIVRDASEVGLYVQTRVKARAGLELTLVFPAEGQRAEVRVAARVARMDRLSAHFAASGAGGLGLEVIEAGRGLGPVLAGAGFTSAAPAPVADATAARPFRVKLTQIAGGRSQTISVSAPTKQGARARALTRAGTGWKISEVCEG